MNNINEFLNYIHGNNKGTVKVHKYVEKLNRKAMSTVFHNKINEENKLGDVYFVVNSGGDKDDMITNFNAVFVDLDCGRDENKNYYSLDIAREFKNKKLIEINNFEIKPTFIIETRNGLHVYWALKNDTNIYDWTNCIHKLISKFDGDTQVINPARLMRLPFTKWMKDPANPFDINIVEFNDIKYDISYILNELSDVNVERCGGDIEVFNNTYSNTTTKTIKTLNKVSSNKQLIIDGNIEQLQKLINPNYKVLANQNEFYIHITQEINLENFLGVYGSTFCCIFHDDRNPSAGIFTTNRDQNFYKCHSSNCGFMGNIIRIVERLRRCNRPKAIEFIKQVFKLEISETEWQKQQKIILEENKRMLRDGEFEEYYPEVYKLIKNYKDLIYLLHDIAIDNVYDEKYSDDEDNVVFFASLTKIMGELNYKNSKRIADRNSLLAFLYLINKLTEQNVPESYLTKAKHIAAKNKQKSLVNFFSIPSYCDEVLEKSLERASMFKDNNMTMRGWSRELLQRTFGDEIANEIYPQFTHRKVPKNSVKKTNDIHKLVNEILDYKGYVLEKEIIEELRNIYGKARTEVQIKKSLQEMLDTYGLKRIRCNNKIKEVYGVVGNGYPFIIVKNS